MRRLPLYSSNPDELRTEVERAIPLDQNPGCERCDLHERAKTVCISPEGEPGGLLLIGEGPGKQEDAVGRPFIGTSGRFLRDEVKKHWKGPVAIDSAIRCFPGRVKVTPKQMDACRGYLAATLKEAKPTRVIALGGKACQAVLGFYVPINSTRRGFAWLYNDGNPLPLYMVNHPAAAMRNRFVRREFETSLKWALETDPPDSPPWHLVGRIIETPKDAVFATNVLRSSEWFTYDCETHGKLFNNNFAVSCIAASTKEGREAFIWNANALANDKLSGPLFDLLQDPRSKIVGQYVKYDMLAVRCAFDVIVKRIHGDTRLWRHLINTDADGSLAVMAHLVGMGGHKGEAVASMAKGMRKVQKALRQDPIPDVILEGLDPAIDSALRLGADPKQFKYSMMPDDVLWRYVGRDAIATAKLGDKFEDRLQNEDSALTHIWDSVIKNITPALEQVEAWGMGVNREAIKTVGEFFKTKIEAANSRLDAYSFNSNSTLQLQKLLYDDLKLTPTKYTKTGKPSTDREALGSLRGQHPIIDDILMYRKYTKLFNTYAEGLENHIRDDGRIHPNLKPDGARTGRLSCTDPNLQNIPSEKELEGRMLRDCFVADDGNYLVTLDYSQIELRVAAMLSNDPEMKAIYESGIDLHMRTAELIAPMVWGISASAVTAKHRRVAKSFNFGLIYGMGDTKLAAALGISVAQATKVRGAILGKFVRLGQWTKQCLLETQRTGFTWTYWEGKRARRRPLYGVADPDSLKRSTAEHASWNTPVQGTANEYNSRSLIEIVDYIQQDFVPAKVVLAIHDSIMLEVREDVLEEVIATSKDIMVSWYSDDVPLVVDVEIGKAWGSMVQYLTEEEKVGDAIHRLYSPAE